MCVSIRRWCPSRRRLSLLEEVETGVMTMLSKEVGRALRGYCPQSIREGLVSRRAPPPPCSPRGRSCNALSKAQTTKRTERART